MESKIAGMIGVAALAALGSTEALAAPDPDAALQAKSFAELLQPIPNATALLENAASEQGARMSAMDNATRNAGDLITRLTIEYNRSRQAAITTELVEIISGAEAL